MMRPCMCSMCPFTVIQGAVTVFFQHMRWDYQPVTPSVGPQHVKWCPTVCVEDSLLFYVQVPWHGWSPPHAVQWADIRENMMSVLSAWKTSSCPNTVEQEACVNDFCFCWRERSDASWRPLMQLSIVLQSCRKLKEKIRGALARGRRGGGRERRSSTSGFSGTWHTEMN